MNTSPRDVVHTRDDDKTIEEFVYVKVMMRVWWANMMAHHAVVYFFVIWVHSL